MALFFQYFSFSECACAERGRGTDRGRRTGKNFDGKEVRQKAGQFEPRDRRYFGAADFLHA
jgi:hypothetical protein